MYCLANWCTTWYFILLINNEGCHFNFQIISLILHTTKPENKNLLITRCECDISPKNLPEQLAKVLNHQHRCRLARMLARIRVRQLLQSTRRRSANIKLEKCRYRELGDTNGVSECCRRFTSVQKFVCRIHKKKSGNVLQKYTIFIEPLYGCKCAKYLTHKNFLE